MISGSNLSPQVAARLQALLQDSGRGTEVWPDVPLDLLVFLESLYPPRCMGRNETAEDNLRYAGAVALVEDMRFHYEAQREVSGTLDEDLKPGEVEIPL